jgi:hypothetical protein
MQKLKGHYIDALVPFVCGLLSSAWLFVFFDLFDLDLYKGFTNICFLVLNLFLPFTPMLLIPAIQLRSRRLALRALWLGPVLVFVQMVLSFFLTVDRYRLLTPFPILVPGLNEMTPGGSIENLVPLFGVHVAILTVALSRRYSGTRLLRIPYSVRVILGGFILLYVLHLDIEITTVWWSDTCPVPLEHFRRNWIIASITWLCLMGTYWSFVFGVQPQKEKGRDVLVA